jgi:hypothetical protein
MKIGEQGVFKLLKDINPSKATGLDQIPNIVLKTCAKTLAPGMTKVPGFWHMFLVRCSVFDPAPWLLMDLCL